MKVEHINKDNFSSKVLENKNPVLVDFFANWCGPCKMLAPVLEQVKDDIGDKASIFKLDIDENLELAKKFGVMSIPTMILFKDGREAERIIGLRQKSQIIDAINNL